MPRRSVALTLLILLAVPLAGSIVFASECFEPCPDDTEETSCPPVCSVCTSCTHAQTAIVRDSVSGVPLTTAPHRIPKQALSQSSQLADDIFHVPLRG